MLECCLCMERFEESDEVRLLPCGHYYHKSCVDRWFATKRYQVVVVGMVIVIVLVTAAAAAVVV